MVIIDWLQTLAIALTSLIAIVSSIYLIFKKVIKPIARDVQALNAVIDRELTHNGGSSALDAITRIEGKVDAGVQLIMMQNNKLEAHISDNAKHTT